METSANPAVAVILFGALYLIVFGMLGWWVATQKGRRAVEGVLLAVLFSFVGVIIEALLPAFPNERRID